MSTTYKNPDTSQSESASLAWLWTLLFGSLYFAVKGIWTHTFISLVLAIVTSGISWLVYPFFADSIVKHHYIGKGWVEE